MSPSFVFCEYCKTDLVTCENENFKVKHVHACDLYGVTYTDNIHS